MGGAGAGAGAAAAAAQIARATKASGAIIGLDPEEWRRIAALQERPLVVHARSWLFTANHRYLTSYKGLIFFTKSPEPIRLPPDAEVVEADKIWVP